MSAYRHGFPERQCVYWTGPRTTRERERERERERDLEKGRWGKEWPVEGGRHREKERAGSVQREGEGETERVRERDRERDRERGDERGERESRLRGIGRWTAGGRER